MDDNLVEANLQDPEASVAVQIWQVVESTVLSLGELLVQVEWDWQGTWRVESILVA
tara:strand:+ start:131 stop:298 length:168 start_codon:yes stop_codon:yes gene_type:complete